MSVNIEVQRKLGGPTLKQGAWKVRLEILKIEYLKDSTTISLYTFLSTLLFQRVGKKI